MIGPIIRKAPEMLRAGGILAIEFGLDQADAVRDAIVAACRFAEPRILRDHQGMERAAVANRK
jgi:methylase of polypeptide subunit release factors